MEEDAVTAQAAHGQQSSAHRQRCVPVVAVALLLVLAPVAPAQAELAEPFAEASAICAPSKPSQHSGTPVRGNHVHPLVRVEGSGVGGGNADFPLGPDDIGVWETFWRADHVQFWREAATMSDGTTATVGTDCGLTPTAYTVAAKWYDRPAPPAAFSGDSTSVAGFRAPRPGRYVVDVTPPPTGLRVAMEDHQTGEANQWHAEAFREATFSRPGTLDLGVLRGGEHDLTVGWRGPAIRGAWSVHSPFRCARGDDLTTGTAGDSGDADSPRSVSGAAALE